MNSDAIKLICLYNHKILHNNLYISRNVFAHRSNTVFRAVHMRGHYLRQFISNVNSNDVKYAFFHHTATLWNAFRDIEISV